MIKKAIKFIFSSLGYEIINKSILGNDIYRDLISLSNKKDKLIIFDVGANLGQTALEFARYFPESVVYSLEPDPKTFDDLINQTQMHSKIKPYNIGLGSVVDRMELNINKATGGNSLLELSENIHLFASGDWTEKTGTKQVEITTLDLFCTENKIEGIDILKIDTQGYELKIIEGGFKTIVPSFTKIIYLEVVFVELYKEQCYFSDIFEILTKKGYKLLGLYNKFQKEEKPNYLLWCDAVFVCEDF